MESLVALLREALASDRHRAFDVWKQIAPGTQSGLDATFRALLAGAPLDAATAGQAWQLLGGPAFLPRLEEWCRDVDGRPLRGADARRLAHNARRHFLAGLLATQLGRDRGELPTDLRDALGLTGRLCLATLEAAVRDSQPAAHQAALHDACAALRSLLPGVEPLPLWLALRYWLLGPDQAVPPTVGVVRRREVGLVSVSSTSQAVTLYRLHLALLPEGLPGGLVEHPGLWCRPLLPSYLAPIDAAFRRHPFAGPVVWGLGWHPTPLAPLAEGSHGLACYAGFRALAEDLPLDPECLLAAEVHGDEIRRVDHLHAKWEAARAQGCRRVVVALDAVGLGSEEAIHRVGDLDRAFELATGLARELRTYLEGLAGHALEQLAACGGDRVEPEVYLPPDNPGAFPGSAAQAPEAGWPRRRWSDVLGRVRQAIVLGETGSGKTVLLWQTLRALALQGLRELDDLHQAGVAWRDGVAVTRAADVTVPLWLHLPAVVEAGDLLAGFRRTLEPLHLGLRETTFATLLERPAGPNTWRILVGLNGVAEDSRGPLLDRLAPLLAGRGQGRVVVADRPGSALCNPPLGRRFEVFHLAPLDHRQQADLARAAGVEPVLAALRTSPAFRPLLESPLWLSRLLGAPALDLAAAPPRGQALGQAIREQVRGAGRPDQWLEGPLLCSFLQVVQDLAAALVSRSPGRGRSPHADWAAELRRALRGRLAWTEQEVLQRLTDVGLIRYHPGGLVEFAYPQVRDRLAAAHLAESGTWEAALPGLLACRSTRAVVVFLAGCLPEPEPLLDGLLARHRAGGELLPHALLLAGRCLAETGPTPRADAIVAEVIATWRELGHAPAVLEALRHEAGCRGLLGLVEAGGEVARAATEALGRIAAGTDWVERLGRIARAATNSEVRRAAVCALGRMGEPAALPVLRRWADEDAPLPLRGPALAALAACGDPDLGNRLRAAIFGEAPDDLRARATHVAASLPLHEALPLLREALTTSGLPASVRIAALDGLARLRDPGLPALLATLLEEPLPEELQTAVVRSLGRHGGAEAFDRLVALLDAPAVAVRIAAVRALGETGDRRAWELLCQHATGPAAPVRTAALRGLGDLGDERALPLLLAALEEPEPADAAAVALGHLGDPAAVPALLHALEDGPASRFAATLALSWFDGPEVVAALCGVLEDAPEDHAAVVAAQALGRRGVEAAVPGLLRMLHHPLPHQEGHTAAAWALGAALDGEPYR